MGVDFFNYKVEELQAERVSALECGYTCERTGRTIRAWELR